jgi:hypothetical protein
MPPLSAVQPRSTRPTLWRYFFAYVAQLVLVGSSLAAPIIVAAGCLPGAITSLSGAIWLAVAMLSAIPLGFMLGFFALACALGPMLFNVFAGLNGRPFQPGDRVRILSGFYRGRTGSIAQVWTERGTVIVGFDGPPPAGTKEIWQMQVFREQSALSAAD